MGYPKYCTLFSQTALDTGKGEPDCCGYWDLFGVWFGSLHCVAVNQSFIEILWCVMVVCFFFFFYVNDYSAFLLLQIASCLHVMSLFYFISIHTILMGMNIHKMNSILVHHFGCINNHWLSEALPFPNSVHWAAIFTPPHWLVLIAFCLLIKVKPQCLWRSGLGVGHQASIFCFWVLLLANILFCISAFLFCRHPATPVGTFFVFTVQYSTFCFI